NYLNFEKIALYYRQQSGGVVKRVQNIQKACKYWEHLERLQYAEMTGPYSLASLKQGLFTEKLIIKIQALSIACLMNEGNIDKQEDAYVLNEKINTFAEAIQKKEGAKLIDHKSFHLDPAPGMATAFLVG